MLLFIKEPDEAACGVHAADDPAIHLPPFRSTNDIDPPNAPR